MKMIFLDTSAFFAMLDKDDAYHSLALNFWVDLLEQKSKLHTNNYVLVETIVLLQNRLGMAPLSDLQKIMPLLQIDWITADQHNTSINYLLTSNRRRLSLVDCSSFVTMRRLGINKAFTFDKHFEEQGFEKVP